MKSGSRRGSSFPSLKYTLIRVKWKQATPPNIGPVATCVYFSRQGEQNVLVPSMGARTLLHLIISPPGGGGQNMFQQWEGSCIPESIANLKAGAEEEGRGRGGLDGSHKYTHTKYLLGLLDWSNNMTSFPANLLPINLTLLTCFLSKQEPNELHSTDWSI